MALMTRCSRILRTHVIGTSKTWREPRFCRSTAASSINAPTRTDCKGTTNQVGEPAYMCGRRLLHHLISQGSSTDKCDPASSIGEQWSALLIVLGAFVPRCCPAETNSTQRRCAQYLSSAHVNRQWHAKTIFRTSRPAPMPRLASTLALRPLRHTEICVHNPPQEPRGGCRDGAGTRQWKYAPRVRFGLCAGAHRRGCIKKSDRDAASTGAPVTVRDKHLGACHSAAWDTSVYIGKVCRCAGPANHVVAMGLQLCCWPLGNNLRSRRTTPCAGQLIFSTDRTLLVRAAHQKGRGEDAGDAKCPGMSD